MPEVTSGNEPNQPRQPKPEQPPIQQAFRFSNVAYSFILTFALLAGLGYAADQALHTQPAGVLIGCFGGFVTATWLALRELRRME